MEAKKKAEEEIDEDPWMLKLKRQNKDLNDDELMKLYQQEMVEQEKAKKAATAELLHGLSKKKPAYK